MSKTELVNLVEVDPRNEEYDSSTKVQFRELHALLAPGHELFFVGTTSEYYEVYLPTKQRVVRVTEAVSVFLAKVNPDPDLEDEYRCYYLPKKALKDPDALTYLLDSISFQYLGFTGLLFNRFENK